MKISFTLGNIFFSHETDLADVSDEKFERATIQHRKNVRDDNDNLQLNGLTIIWKTMTNSFGNSM